ncbi:MAG: hypothetical protein HY791_21570 [Deltaproteobacteria bacterium]|nr:hypothetical protein [Deltaproteobacteria bacterium]
MTRVSDQIKGLTFAQSVMDGGVSLKSLRSDFMSLPPIAQEAAASALRDSGDPLLSQLAQGLSPSASTDSLAKAAPARPAARSSGGEGVSSSGSRVRSSG